MIPVSAGNKRKLNGFIHDESATGKTFYIEPVEVVELNNALRELEYAERREIVRLLTEFTDSLRPDAEPIAAAGEYLAEMDAVRAKARWALERANLSFRPTTVWSCAMRFIRCWPRRCAAKRKIWCRSICSSTRRGAYWSSLAPMRAASRCV